MRRGRELVVRREHLVARTEEEVEVVVRELRAVVGEGPAHDRGDVDLVVVEEREELLLVLAEVAEQGVCLREAVRPKRLEAGAVPREGDLVAPFLLHERSAPVEENRPQHDGRVGARWCAGSSGARWRLRRSRSPSTTSPTSATPRNS